MNTHNLCFRAEIRKIMYTPVNINFTIKMWDLRGSKLYRYVFVMWYKPPSSYPTDLFKGVSLLWFFFFVHLWIHM